MYSKSWLIPKAEKFPRNYRFSIGERLVGASLDLLLSLVDAAYSTDKTRALERAARSGWKGWGSIMLASAVPV